MKTHPRRLAALLLLSACCFTHAAIYAATMASQPWVTNRIAEAEARTDAKITAATNAIPAPVVDLTPATNYTDTAVSAMGSVLRDTIAESAQASTNHTNAVAAEFENGTRTAKNADFAENAITANEACALLNSSGDQSYSATELFTESTNAAIAVAAGKQDALPYPTNAIPYAAISGGPVWRVTEFDANTPVSFVTNGIAAKLINGELYADAAGWPDGAAMFVRGSVVPWPYDVGENIRLVGYGTWPTNNFQSVWWRSGATIYVNILVED